MLYDGIGRHLVVLRNGAQIGDWKFNEDEDKDANKPAPNEEERNFTISGVCFDSEEHGKRSGLRFNRLRVQSEDRFDFRGSFLRAATQAANGFRLRPIRDAKRAATPATGGGHGHGQPRAERFPDVCVNCNGGECETPLLASWCVRP